MAETAGPSPTASSTVQPRLRRRLRLEVRQRLPFWHHALLIALSIAVGLGISLAILALAGVAPGGVFDEFIGYTFFDAAGLSNVLVETGPLTLVGLSAAIAFRVQFWNIGIEGQFFFGVIGATFFTVYGIGDPSYRIVLMAAGAIIGGALWTVVPAFLKLRLGVNEIITTLLLNYVALRFVEHLVYGAWQDPTAQFPRTAQYQDFERLPLLGWQRVDAGLIVALVATLVIWWLMSASRFGRYMRFVGANPRMSLAVGVPVTLVVFGAVLASGALSGLAGYAMAAAQEFRLTPSMAAGYGFSGIVIAFLARNNPVLVLVVAFLFGGLYVGGQSLQVFYNLPTALVGLIQATIVMCLAGADFMIRYRMHLVR